jgi:hypothetical protein
MSMLSRMCALAWCAPVALSAQSGVHVLVITGLSAEPAAAKRFAESAIPVVDAAKSKWGVADSSLIYLAEDPAVDKRITGKSTQVEIENALHRIAKRAAPDDEVLILLIGHGSDQGDSSKVSLPGPDPTARDYATMLLPLAKQRVVFIVAASGSGDFLPVLSAKGRIVITATKTALERNESLFSLWIAKGLTDDAADANKDGEISVLEAFTFARTELAKVYVAADHLQTEHPQLDDNGDRKPTADPVADMTPDSTGVVRDGLVASRVTFGGPAVNDPRIAALVAERRVLERDVETLRTKKGFMVAADYDKELERLLIAIAEKSAAIKAILPVKKP